jgi:hypothetical protein
LPDFVIYTVELDDIGVPIVSVEYDGGLIWNSFLLWFYLLFYVYLDMGYTKDMIIGITLFIMVI